MTRGEAVQREARAPRAEAPAAAEVAAERMSVFVCARRELRMARPAVDTHLRIHRGR